MTNWDVLRGILTILTFLALALYWVPSIIRPAQEKVSFVILDTPPPLSNAKYGYDGTNTFKHSYLYYRLSHKIAQVIKRDFPSRLYSDDELYAAVVDFIDKDVAQNPDLYQVYEIIYKFILLIQTEEVWNYDVFYYEIEQVCAQWTSTKDARKQLNLENQHIDYVCEAYRDKFKPAHAGVEERHNL